MRHRRIKGLEAEKRKVERSKAESEKWLAEWSRDNSLARARQIANVCWLTVLRDEAHPHGLTAYDVLREDPPKWTVAQVREVAQRV